MRSGKVRVGEGRKELGVKQGLLVLIHSNILTAHQLNSQESIQLTISDVQVKGVQYKTTIDQFKSPHTGC